MNMIFLDLEMNTIKRDYAGARIISKNEVIEFGAVRLNEQNEVIGTFQCYVRPAYCDGIAPSIVHLTGITDEQVMCARGFNEVFAQFLDWCETDYEIYSWSDNDPIQLQREMLLKGFGLSTAANYMFAHWKDLQEEYGALFHRERLVALATATYNAGVEFRGRAHSALMDAYATADLYKEMVDGSTLRTLKEELDEARTPLGTCLGDLLAFDLAVPA